MTEHLESPAFHRSPNDPGGTPAPTTRYGADWLRSRLDDLRDGLAVLEARGVRGLANLHAWGGLGYATKSSGTVGGTGAGGHSDPTFVAASIGLSEKDRDRWARQHADVTDAVEQAVLAVARAVDIIDGATNTAELPPADGCSVCARVVQIVGVHDCSRACRDRDPKHQHPDAWQPIYGRRRRPGHEADTLALLVPYCSFCWKWIDRWGVEPHPRIGLYHLDHPGTRIPNNLIRECHPDEWARGRLTGNAA